MDKLFSGKQAVPTATLTTTAGNHLASIATTMLSAVTWFTSKAAANHANVNREETIDYKDMSTDVRDQCDLKIPPEKVMTMDDMKPYHNNLTQDQHDAKQNWRMVEYPDLGNGNTTKHDGQTYVTMSDGTLSFDHGDAENMAARYVFILRTNVPGPRIQKGAKYGYFGTCTLPC